jgi:hypothetical protein
MSFEFVGARAGAQIGSIDGVGTSLKLNNPSSLCLSPDDATLYVAEKVRRMERRGGRVGKAWRVFEGDSCFGASRLMTQFCMWLERCGEEGEGRGSGGREGGRVGSWNHTSAGRGRAQT